jgi:CheY-like chemotaxis protein
MGERGRPSAAVLIVEDEPLIRMGAVSLIEDAGFEVYEAASADAAIALIELHDGDLSHLYRCGHAARWTDLNSPTMLAADGRQLKS